MIRVKGDLLEMFRRKEIDVLVHGCNCMAAMGGGIAKQIATRYPQAAKVDQIIDKYYKDNRIPLNYKLGNYSCSVQDNGQVIVNAYTQYQPSTGEDVFEYNQFEVICNKLLGNFPCEIIGMPYIGMGLAKGNSEKIFSILEKFSEDFEKVEGKLYLVEYEKN